MQANVAHIISCVWLNRYLNPFSPRILSCKRWARKKKIWVKLAQSSVEDEALSSIRNSRDCDARNLREPSSRDWNFRDGFRERKTLISQRERERERERGLWKKARAVNDGEWSEFGERELWDISFQIVIRFDRSLK